MKCIAVTFVGHHSGEKLQSAGADLVVASLEMVSVEMVQQLLDHEQAGCGRPGVIR